MKKFVLILVVLNMIILPAFSANRRRTDFGVVVANAYQQQLMSNNTAINNQYVIDPRELQYRINTDVLNNSNTAAQYMANQRMLQDAAFLQQYGMTRNQLQAIQRAQLVCQGDINCLQEFEMQRQRNEAMKDYARIIRDQSMYVNVYDNPPRRSRSLYYGY